MASCVSSWTTRIGAWTPYTLAIIWICNKARAPASRPSRSRTPTVIATLKPTMKLRVVLLSFAAWILAACVPLRHGPSQSEPWRAVHLLNYNSDADLETLGGLLPKLAAMGVNVIVLEVDYNFTFQSHPELRQGKNPITEQGAARIAGVCSELGIRLIPQFQCLGHQSWAKKTFPLLTVYPQFDLTPGAFPDNKGIYCREWNVLDADLNRIVCSLLDEIIEAFRADALHVGMDEVFLLGSKESPATHGKDPAKLFARCVNDLHGHLVGKRGVEMLMWGDRLIDATKYSYGKWEASANGTAAAIDMVPRDIIICDWHYEQPKVYKLDSYPSIPMFVAKGFRVLTAGWKDVEATKALIRSAQAVDDPKVLGHLFTIWGRKDKMAEWAPIVEGLKLLHAAPNDR